MLIHDKTTICLNWIAWETVFSSPSNHIIHVHSDYLLCRAHLSFSARAQNVAVASRGVWRIYNIYDRASLSREKKNCNVIFQYAPRPHTLYRVWISSFSMARSSFFFTWHSGISSFSSALGFQFLMYQRRAYDFEFIMRLSYGLMCIIYVRGILRCSATRFFSLFEKSCSLAMQLYVIESMERFWVKNWSPFFMWYLIFKIALTKYR